MEIKRTITGIFMVPTLKIPFGKLEDNGYLNAYIKDGGREEQYENAVYLLFQPKNIDKFRVFLEEEYERTKSVIDDYDYEDGYVVVVYKLDPVLKSDFDLIRKGKYSKTSPMFQQLFPKSIRVNSNGISKEQITLQYRIFNKTDDLLQFWEDKFGMHMDKDQELWYAFVEENEILDIEKIRSYAR